jgi:hypothetical protein
MNDTVRQILIVLAVILTLTVNGLANALPLNGLTTGEISDSFDVLFVPAGYVFSIWGLIYLGLIGYAVFQALPAQPDNPRLRRIGGAFLVASVANSSWILLWHYQFFALTLIAMLSLLGSLIVIYQRLRVNRPEISSGERWFVRLPFSVYLGWVSVATIANFTSVLDFFNWGGFGLSEVAWAVIMLVVGLVLAGVMTWRERDAAYNLVFVWAYIGIGVAQADSPWVATTANIGAVIAALFALAVLLTSRPKPAPVPA